MVNPVRFNVDLTGTNVNNKIVNEPHTLPVKKYRSIAPKYGPYFTESLVIRDGSSGNILEKDIDYRCLDVVGIPTAQSGKEICTIVVITTPLTNNTVFIDYQALGGDYTHTHEAVKQLIDNLLIDDRSATWPGISNRPDSFNPSHHLHRIGDAIGFEYLVSSLERLRTAILLGDEISHTEILSYLDASIESIKHALNDTTSLLTLMGVTAASDANSSAAQALQNTIQYGSSIQIALNELTQTRSILNELISDLQSSETNAINLLEQYSL